VTRELLLEIGCEEIPAWMIPDALAWLTQNLSQILARHQLAGDEPWASATPRRLTVRLAGIPDSQPDREEEILGPPASIGVDSGGAFTKAALGFGKKQGAAETELRVIETAKGAYVGIRKQIQGRPAGDVLSEILPPLIAGIPWPKTMYWRADRFRFVRPIRNLLCLLDGEVIPFEVAGVATSDRTFGHRFLGHGSIPVRAFADYRASLADNRVMVDASERAAKIDREMRIFEQETGLRMVPDAGLAREVVHLNEYPTVILGTFEEKFLAIPEEVLVTVMRKHQKYFALTGADGRLAPRFLAVINMDADRQGLIRQGHERVLKARLVDAEFFWNGDRKRSLADRVPGLANVLFQESLGSYLEKSERLQHLASFVASKVGNDSQFPQSVRTAARLCKADLTTDMVKEITELQGVMGGLYAREEGLAETVWKSIYEHYRPEGMDDSLPESAGGAVLALADKIDTIAGMLGLGFVPTGSKDPFGLRRLANGVYRILLERGLDLDLREMFLEAYRLLAGKIPVDWDALLAVLTEFLETRLRFFYQNAGFRYDEINAVIERSVFRPVDGRRRLDALQAIRPVATFTSIFKAKKRIQNILDKQGGAAPVWHGADKLAEPEEIALHRLLTETGGAIAAAVERMDYPSALSLIGGFSKPVDDFFDRVLVMHDDPVLRSNRLTLLCDIGKLFDRFCDFSKFVIEEP
jgi:glycyl-tRNA synthetase beta chain